MSQIQAHYNLAVQPFGVTPDPRFLYLSATHGEAMASLLYGIRAGRGFTALIAAPGMGKTTLLFNLLSVLKGDVKTAYLFQTLAGPGEFLNALLADLGIKDDGENITRKQAKLNEYLLGESRHGRQIVVIVDEAQNLDEQTLELLRMLSNFETAEKKLLHIVLAGQPQLAEKLDSASLIQLKQRISIVARLAPFKAHETREYIEHRLKLAGNAGSEPLFTDGAYALIAEHSQGVPRNISNLCFNAMSLGCALKRSIVDGALVQEVVNDLDLKTIAAAPKKSDELGRRPSFFGGGISPFSGWRPEVLVTIAVLFSLVWPISKVVTMERAQFLPEQSARASQLETNDNSGLVATSRTGAPVRNRGRVSRPVSVATAETPQRRTRMEKAARSEGVSRAKAVLQMTAIQNASPAVIVDTAGHARQRSNAEDDFDLLLKEVGLTEQTRNADTPATQRPDQESQSTPEQGIVPFDSTAQRVTP